MDQAKLQEAEDESSGRADIMRKIHASGLEPHGDLQPWGPEPVLYPRIDRPRPREIMFASETFRRHMTNEGWQIQDGLEQAGVGLYGRYLENNQTDVKAVVRQTDPDIAYFQEKTQWDPKSEACFDKTIEFHNVPELARRKNCLRVAIYKDVGTGQEYQREWHRQLKPHLWAVYYHKGVANRLAPWMPVDRMVRTYHTLNIDEVPKFATQDKRAGVFLSGAMSPLVYYLRSRLLESMRQPQFKSRVVHMGHPGYHAKGWVTPQFLKLLSKFRVSICTSSAYAFSLRKIVESTAAGCVVITDLPSYDKLPYIDGNLIRVPYNIGIEQLVKIAEEAAETWNYEWQRSFAELAARYYDYRVVTRRLAQDVRDMWATRNWRGAQE